MAGQVSSPIEIVYDILIEDADGRHLWLEGVPDLETARVRMPALAAQYPGMRLILWNHMTRTILASTDGY
jgi:hypothetical protein